jgi:molecular chaperone HtpG
MNEQSVPLTVDVQDILPIIKRFMYAERGIFLRELISNSIDALEKLSRIALSDPTFCDGRDPMRVEVSLDPVNSIVTVTDNGVGMTREEVVRYVNQIAFSGAREFMDKYSKGENELIGRFGLGFYSSFMVSTMVEIDTLSRRPGSIGCHWQCDGSAMAQLGESPRQRPGTTVICHLSDDAREFLDIEQAERVIRYYLDYAPYPIFLSGRQVNVVVAPWHLNSAERESLPRERYWAFYERLNANENRPLAWFHVETDYPLQVRALLFVPDRPPESRGSVRIFANRTFICSHSEAVLPKWLDFLVLQR